MSDIQNKFKDFNGVCEPEYLPESTAQNMFLRMETSLGSLHMSTKTTQTWTWAGSMASWGMPREPTMTLADVDTCPDIVRLPPLAEVVGVVVDRPVVPVDGASGGALWTMCRVFPLTSAMNKDYF